MTTSILLLEFVASHLPPYAEIIRKALNVLGSERAGLDGRRKLENYKHCRGVYVFIRTTPPIRRERTDKKRV